jgi:hypothetical protein
MFNFDVIDISGEITVLNFSNNYYDILQLNEVIT